MIARANFRSNLLELNGPGHLKNVQCSALHSPLKEDCSALCVEQAVSVAAMANVIAATHFPVKCCVETVIAAWRRKPS
ncbi:hypothetical protein ETAA8_42670 [Anatilimnocola aggregata]|uniref:Uncharacterized protein n=1 Tax=Anatilimnocola aggregata TaxID=2528021 RepID=A0A517YG00_9BACT|nr:hypothetical protein ETAA8_42670 [Anatilimnocola aggregata]